MKKIFLIGLTAAAMLASCSNDETVEMAQQKAIGFSNAFVNNGTRSVVDPSFTTTSLNDFAVYGFTQNGQIFNGEKVSKTGDAWSYVNVQYWVCLLYTSSTWSEKNSPLTTSFRPFASISAPSSAR